MVPSFPSHSHMLWATVSSSPFLWDSAYPSPRVTRFPIANSQFLTVTALTLRLRGLSYSTLTPPFAPRSSPCKAGDRTSRPLWGLSQSHFNTITGVLGAEGSRRFGLNSCPDAANSTLQAPPRRHFRRPFQCSHSALLSLSAPEKSKAPQLPMATAPGEARSHPATDGKGYSKVKPSPRFDILDAGKRQKGSRYKGFWDMNFDAPPSLVT